MPRDALGFLCFLFFFHYFEGKNNFCFISSLYEIPTVSSSSFFEEFGKLLRETDEMDNIHDVTFQIGSRLFPAHKYILAVRSDFFQKLFLSDGTALDFTDVYRKDEDSTGCHLFVVEKVHPDLFECLLQFIYTDTCDFLTHGFKPRLNLNRKPEGYPSTPNCHSNKMNSHEDNQKSAFEAYKSNQAHTISEKQKSKSKSSKKVKSVGEDDPVKMLQNVAKKFGFSNLSSRYDSSLVSIHVPHYAFLLEILLLFFFFPCSALLCSCCWSWSFSSPPHPSPSPPPSSPHLPFLFSFLHFPSLSPFLSPSPFCLDLFLSFQGPVSLFSTKAISRIPWIKTLKDRKAVHGFELSWCLCNRNLEWQAVWYSRKSTVFGVRPICAS